MFLSFYDLNKIFCLQISLILLSTSLLLVICIAIGAQIFKDPIIIALKSIEWLLKWNFY